MAITTVSASGHLAGAQDKQAFNATTGAFGAYNTMLKEFYLPGVLDVLNSKRVLVRYLRRNTRDVMGKTIHTAINVGRNIGTQHIMEGAQLPDPGKQSYAQDTYTTKYHYGRVLFTGQAASGSRGGRGAFLRLMDGEVQGLTRDIQHEMNRVFFGDGSGRLAQVRGAVAHAAGFTTIPVQNPGGIVAANGGTEYFEIGMRIAAVKSASEAGTPVGQLAASDFRNTNGGTTVSTTVTAVDASAREITVVGDFTGANAIAANDYLYLVTTDTLNTTNALDAYTNRGHEPNGLAGIISIADPALQRAGDPSVGLGNILVASQPLWSGYQNAAGGVFAEGQLQNVQDGVDVLGDGAIQLWLTTFGVRRAYANDLIGQKRFVNTRELPGGFKALTYNDIPMVVDKDCTPNRCYGIDLDTMELAYENDYSWMDHDGAVLQRLENHDAYQATLYRYHELICRARNRNGVLITITEE